MRIQEYNENLFNCPEGTYFVQCCSADLTLNAGIALQFNANYNIKEKLQEKYPDGVYDELYGNRKWKVECLFEYPVFTLITKEHYYDKPTYKSIYTALYALKRTMEELGVYQVSMPAIGCGLDRLDWKKVKQKIVQVFQETDVCIDVYLLDYGLYEKTVVDKYPSHIEVTPYIQGENFRMEKMLSTWNDGSRRYKPFAYDIVENTILLPNGITKHQIGEWFGTDVFIDHIQEYRDCKYFGNYDMLVLPRDELQEDIINYLSHEGPFINQKGHTQFTLEAATGTGKTVCMITALLKKRIRALIISHQDRIKKQWLDQFNTKTNFPIERICFVSENSLIENCIDHPDEYDIYIVSHQMIHSYVRRYGWERFNLFLTKTGIGVKVIDESHLFFENMMRIDLHTNVYENYYLSATLGRSAERENKIMKSVFKNAIRYVTKKEEIRKHVVYIMVLYNSKPNQFVLTKMQNRYGFSPTRFIQYAISQDKKQDILDMLYRQMKKTEGVEGRTLIVSPTIESSNYIAEQLSIEYPNRKVGSVNSSMPMDVREKNLQTLDIISSTIKSSGTGVDLPKLRFLHCLEPHASMYITKQLAGRLREYSATEYTYMFDYFDLGVPQMYIMMKRHKKVMSEIAVKIEILEF